MNKYIIIYLPNGTELQYSTVDLDDTEVIAVQFIEEVRSATPQVVITSLEDEKTIYKGMPYSLDIWK